MARFCNMIFNVLNLMILIFSIVCIAGVFHLSERNGTDCQKALLPPQLFTGISTFVIATMGLVGSCCRFRNVLAIYITLVSLFVVVQLILTSFTFAITRRDTRDLFLLLGIDHQAVRDLKFLKRFLWNQKHWSNIKNCLARSQICRNLDLLPALKTAEIYKKEVPQILVGCCMPPPHCGFRYENATYWTPPKGGQITPKGDCLIWSNDRTKLCFDCVSCKEGVVSSTRNDWLMLARASLASLLVALFTLIVACSTRRNISRDRYRGYYA